MIGDIDSFRSRTKGFDRECKVCNSYKNIQKSFRRFNKCSWRICNDCFLSKKNEDEK